jgi:uncharacterized protein YdeI (YjbR/CyaY-like superfamily)
MEITQTLYVDNRDAWRAWLAEHYRTAKEIWLVYPRKATGRPRIAYNDAVEEALCFGWIDSTQKTLDDDHTAQRFTPRRAGSGYSQPNKERLARLLAQGKVAADVRAKLPDVSVDGFQAPPDILAALQANPRAWENFQRYSPSYQRIRIAFVEDARERRPEDFRKRLENLVRMSEKDRQYGVNLESYY